MFILVPDAMGKKDVSHVEVTIQQEIAKKKKKSSKEARFMNCGGDHTAFSKDCGKREDEEKINRLMTTKNISAKKQGK